MRYFAYILLPLVFLFGCSQTSIAEDESQAPATIRSDAKTAIFAGGCFWCIEADFEKRAGVLDVVSGYSGGNVPNPTYRQVSRHKTGHYEVIRVTYDPKMVSYRELVDYLLRHIDPFDADGQFCDQGESYRSAIFADGEKEERKARKAIRDAEEELGREIVTAVLARTDFYLAEEYHQDYYKKNPGRYQRYRRGCGRDRRVAEIWGAEN